MTDPYDLIICPNCMRTKRITKEGKLIPIKQVLGGLYEDGSVLIRRHTNGTTIFKSSSYTISCGCGYSLDVKTDGTVVMRSSHMP